MSLTVVVLTKDEAQHIERCLASVTSLADRVVVVDSGSTDATGDLARAAGADVLTHPWTTHADQMNWALDHAAIATAWTMRLDADEVVLPELRAALLAFMAAPGDAVAATCNRRIVFLGRWIRHGGIYPVRQLRIWRTGRGRCEQRWMDEHIQVDGRVAHVDADFADINLNTLGWWTDKHNGYATREVADLLLTPPVTSGLAGRTRVKRWLKDEIYRRAPLGIRALAYFLYRYIIRLGVLDGWQGLVFHTLQGFWYRFLVDAKLREVRERMMATGEPAAVVLARAYALRLGSG